MTIVGWAQIVLVLGAVIVAAVPLGAYIAHVLAGERTIFSRIFIPLERVFYRLSGVDPASEQSWFVYATSMLAFSLVGFLSLYAISGCKMFCRSIHKASIQFRRILPSTRR